LPVGGAIQLLKDPSRGEWNAEPQERVFKIPENLACNGQEHNEAEGDSLRRHGGVAAACAE
jgi:hypothetical protein